MGRRLKVKVTVNIDQEVYEKSHSLGINVSKACENYLRMLNQTIEGNGNPKQVFGEAFSTEKGSEVRSPGFEPGSSTWQRVDWISFKAFLEKDHRPRVADQLASNAEKYRDCLFKRDFGIIRDLDDTVRRGAMCSLSALSKYLGCYDDFRQLVNCYGLKWTGKSSDDIFIERLTRDSDPEKIWNWIRDVKHHRPELSVFMDLLAVSGLRFSEGVNSFNLLVQLNEEGKLNSNYYVADKSTLEHFRFKELFIRKSKKAFISFVPGELVKEIVASQLLNSESIKTVVRRKHLPLRFGDIREAHGTFMIRYLKKEEIDFLHGRVTSGVFMQHYFNPALIVDLKSRVFQGIAEIQRKVKT